MFQDFLHLLHEFVEHYNDPHGPCISQADYRSSPTGVLVHPIQLQSHRVSLFDLHLVFLSCWLDAVYPTMFQDSLHLLCGVLEHYNDPHKPCISKEDHKSSPNAVFLHPIQLQSHRVSLLHLNLVFLSCWLYAVSSTTIQEFLHLLYV